MWHVCGTGEMRTGVCWRDLMETDHMESLRVDGEDNIKIGLQELE